MPPESPYSRQKRTPRVIAIAATRPKSSLAWVWVMGLAVAVYSVLIQGLGF